MNTIKKIAVALAVMMVAAAMAAPAAMGDEAPYTVTVLTGQGTSIGTVSGDFGNVIRGSTDNEITPSFTLTNSGDWDAYVDAKFSTVEGTTYGMPSEGTSTTVIPGTAFSLGPDGGELALKAINTDTRIGTVTAGGTMAYDAILAVPSGQSPEAYSGTVLLTFSNV